MNNRFGVPLATGLAVMWAASLAPGVAEAQQSAAPATAQAKSGGLEEIVVTAQKREENVQQVPIAIEAFNEHMIDSLQITNLEAVAQNAPGLQISRNLGAGQFVLRGIGGFGITPGVEPPVATVVDGVYLPFADGSDFSFNNISNVEVDKGPQGTLFGRNAVGGVINVTTKDPSQTPHVDAQIGYGNFNTVTGNFYGTMGIAPNLAADLALYGENQADGWGVDAYNGQTIRYGHELSARSKWLFTPDDATKFTFIADFDRSKPATVGNGSAVGLNNGLISVPQAGTRHVGGFYDSYTNNPNEADSRQYGFSFKADHDFGWAEGVSLTAWRRGKIAVNYGGSITSYPPTGPQPAGVNTGSIRNEQMGSQEFQLLSPGASAIKWIGGIYLFETEAGYDPLIQASPGKATTTMTDNMATHSYAAYGQATAPVADATRLTIGYRYTLDYRSISGNVISTSTAGVSTVSSSAAQNPGGTSVHWPKSTYKLALDHDFAQDLLGYASYSRGFESGAYNVTTGPAARPFNPETLDAYEIGLKTDLLDHTLRLNTSLFYYQFSNLLVTEFVNNASLSLNAAASTSKGADFDITYVPVSNLSLQLGVDLIDPTYTKFTTAQFFTALPTGLGFSSVTGNATGNTVAYNEKVAARLAAQYRIPTSIGDFMLSGDLHYHGGAAFDVQNLLTVKPYFLVNASAMWTAPSGTWDVTLWTKNLTDLQYADTLGISTTGITYDPGPPRTFGVNVGYHWN